MKKKLSFLDKNIFIQKQNIRITQLQKAQNKNAYVQSEYVFTWVYDAKQKRYIFFFCMYLYTYVCGSVVKYSKEFTSEVLQNMLYIICNTFSL